MEPNSQIAARPHYRREGQHLFFFLSTRPLHVLTPRESKAWDALSQGPVTPNDFADPEALKSLVSGGFAEAIEPVNDGSRQQILVIEPHCDDAALSIGATMWKMRNSVEFHLLTMASRSNYTSAFHLHREFFDREKISAMRAEEGKLFARHLGGHYYVADLPEATLRYDDSDWSLAFYNAHEVPIAIANNRRADRLTLETWIDRVRKFMRGRKFDEIWIPLGAGTHSDHDLTRNAALQMLEAEKPDSIIRLYEDVPYGAQFSEHTKRIIGALRDEGGMLTPCPQDVAAEFPAKLALLSIFASQFKVSAMEASVERSATVDPNVSKVERLWTLDRRPDRLPRNRMWIGSPGVDQAAQQVERFLGQRDAIPRVAIMLIGASGRWNSDIRILADAFPRALFVVYLGPSVASELDSFESRRVEVHRLPGSTRSWLRAAVRELFTPRRIIIAGDAINKAKMLRLLWPMGLTIVCSDMDHIMQALESSH